MKLLRRVLRVHNRDKKAKPVYSDFEQHPPKQSDWNKYQGVHMAVKLVKLFLRNFYTVLEGSYQSYSVMVLGLAGQNLVG